jgi:hypothetical protein
MNINHFQLDRHLHGDKTTGGTTVETTDKEENGVGVAQITVKLLVGTI